MAIPIQRPNRQIKPRQVSRNARPAVRRVGSQPKIEIAGKRSLPSPSAKRGVKKKSGIVVAQPPTFKPVRRDRRPAAGRPAATKQQPIQRADQTAKISALSGRGAGRILVMIACGPSINEVDFTPLIGHPKIDTMAINKPQTVLWPTTFWAFCDNSQYNRNQEAFRTYGGVVVNSSSIRVPHRNQVLIRNRQGKGFSRDLVQGFFIGRSTTYANMQTAMYMGYDSVWIFGCDMTSVGGSTWSYGNNPDVNPKNRVQRFANEAEHYQWAAENLTPQERSRFVFCSAYNPWEFVKAFRHIDHREAVSAILSTANVV